MIAMMMCDDDIRKIRGDAVIAAEPRPPGAPKSWTY